MALSTDTIIISDVHLGSSISHPATLLNFLKNSSFKRLIILGDIFDGIHIHKFEESDWQLLSYFEKIKNEGAEVVWIKGNHDFIDTSTKERLSNIEFVDSYKWQMGDKTYCAIHGHQFDFLAVKNPKIKKITGALHSFFAAYMRVKIIASLLERFHSWARGLSRIISDGAIDYAKVNNIDYIFCGHTHTPMRRDFELANKRQIHYFNAGSWIRPPFSYIYIDEGEPKIGKYMGN